MALRLHQSGGPAGPVLTHALAEAQAVDESLAYARARTLGTVALAMAEVGMADAAWTVAADIPDPRVRAEAVWAVAAARARRRRRRRGRTHAGTSSHSPTALPRTWLLCNAARRSTAAGDDATAGVAFAAALAASQNIGNAFARAQAITRVAATLGALRGSAE